MGYNLYIGEKHVEIYDEGTEDECTRVTADGQYHDDSPAFGEPTDFTNTRWPSYSAWADFARKSGLWGFLFEDARGNIRGGHPGYFDLTAADVVTVSKALHIARKRYPEAAKLVDEGWKYTSMMDDEPVKGFGLVSRATWLHYWVKWAVENCKNPVFANT